MCKRVSIVSVAIWVPLCVACGGDTGLDNEADMPSVDTPDTSDTTSSGDTPVDVAIPTLPPDPGSVTVLAGDSLRGHFDGPAAMARFQGVTAMCRTADALYVSDTFAGTLRKVVLATGDTTTLAGRPGRFALSDGTAYDARFASPRGIACLDDGLLVADSGALRKVAFDGTTTTVAGFPGSPGYVDGPAAEARIGYLIHAMAVHPDGRVFFTDRSNDALRVVDPTTWKIATVSTAVDGPGGLAIDPDQPDRVVVADTFADRVITLDPRGDIAVLPLDPSPNTPQALALDGDTLLVAGFSAELWRYSIRTGRGVRILSDFPGTFASMVHLPPTGDAESRIIYAALEPDALRQVSLTSRTDALFAGPELMSGPRDGPVADARFGFMSGVAAHGASLFIAEDFGLRRLRDGQVDTLSAATVLDPGEPVASVMVDTVASHLWVSLPDANRVVVLGLDSAEAPGTTPDIISIFETLNRPVGLALGPDDGVLVAERGAHRVSVLTEGTALPFVGTGQRGTVDGTLADARFDGPHALAWDGSRGHLWVGQAAGHLRLVEPADDRVTTVLRPGDPTDGALDTARLGLPLGLVMWQDLFILDADPGAIRRLVIEDDAPVRLETLIGGVLGGGMPFGGTASLADAILGSASAGVVVGQDLVVVAEQAVYRVDLGDLLVVGGTGGPELGPCDFEIRLGTGSDGFTPLGETLVLERGAQGLQHVTLSLEAAVDDVTAGFHVTSAALYAAGEETPRARMALTLPWQPGLASGILFVIEDPTRVVDVPLELVVTVQSSTGLGCGRAPIVVSWTP